MSTDAAFWRAWGAGAPPETLGLFGARDEAEVEEITSFELDRDQCLELEDDQEAELRIRIRRKPPH